MTVHFKKIWLAGSDTNKLSESLVEPKPYLYVVGTLTFVKQQTTKLAARQTNRLLTRLFADFHAKTVVWIKLRAPSVLFLNGMNCVKRRGHVKLDDNHNIRIKDFSKLTCDVFQKQLSTD